MKKNYIEDLKRYGWLHFYEMQSVGSDEFLPPIITKGEGIYVYDSSGKRYIDGISGAYCVNIGYGRDAVLKRAFHAARDIHFVSPFSAANEPAIDLSRKLALLAEPVLGENPRVFFLNSGSEAIDAAIKISRAYAKRRYGSKNKYKIICRDFSYHGGTYGAMSCSSYDLKKEFFPLVPGIVRIQSCNCKNCDAKKQFDNCDLDCVKDLLDRISEEGADTIAAVLIEPVETNSGMIPPPHGYLDKVAEICKNNDILLILDEVITSFGRLGYWFGAEAYKLMADVVVCSKGLTSGYDSLSALLVSNMVSDVFYKGDMFENGSTFGGRPGAAAAALENISIIENERILENVRTVSEYFYKNLYENVSGLSLVGDIRHAGLLIGIDLVEKNKKDLLSDADKIRHIRKKLLKNGLITSTFGDRNEPVIGLAPPLVMSHSEADTIVEILYNSLADE